MYLFLQILVGFSVLFGFSNLIDTAQEDWVNHLAAGSWALSLLFIGCLIVPQKMLSDKYSGIQKFLLTLPVPRSCLLVADAIVWASACMPGFAVSIGLAALRFRIHVNASPWIVVFLLLALIVYMLVGYSLAVWIPPTIVSLATQVIILGAMLFSPITYPAERIPGWANTIHQFLPFTPGANLVREGFFSTGKFPLLDVIVVVAWSAVLLVVVLKGLSRRI